MGTRGSDWLTELRYVIARARRTLYQLAIYIILVGFGSVFAIDLLTFAWTSRPWGIVRHLLIATYSFLSMDAATFYYFPTGVFAGLLTVLLIDSYKRAQGVILWAGIAIGSFVVLLGEGLLITPLIEAFSPIAGSFGLIGVATGLLIGGVRPAHVVSNEGELAFPQAPRRLFLLAALLVGYGLFEAILFYESPVVGVFVFQPLNLERILIDDRILLDAIMSGLGLVGLYKFTSYENHTKMILIGPQRSGKSASFGGLQLAVRDLIDEQAGIKSNTHVTSLSDKIANGQFPDATVRQSPRPLEINYRAGKLFPERKTIQSVDYAGELLPQILDPVIEDRVLTDGGQVSEEEPDGDEGPTVGDFLGETEDDDDDSTFEYLSAGTWEEATDRLYQADESTAPDAIWDSIEHADRIIMTIPLDDFITPIVERGNWPSYQPIETFSDDLTPEEIREEYDVPPEVELHPYGDGYYYYADEPDRADPSEYLSWYRDLAREFRGEKEFVLAVTMADWATEDFERENPRGLNPHVESNYPDFCQYVYEQVMLEENANVRDLLTATTDDQIHALWYSIENSRPPGRDEDYRIDTGSVSAIQDKYQTPLNGAKQLVERLNR